MLLNSEQLKAIEIIDKPLIVIAGPGTGKTTLITEKINFLLNEKQFKEDEVLAITFTKKAAQEMSNRVNSNFNAKTFHEFALEIIEDYQRFIPYLDKDFILIEENVQKVFFLENIDEFKFNSIEIKNNQNLIAFELQSQISKLKDFGYYLKDLEKIKTENLQLKLDIFSAYSKYELYKKKNNFLDFGDLLLYVLDLLKNNEKIKLEIQNKFKYILVDEFQDTNLVQLEILKLLAKNNITIVGDQKQSIYSFRGANFVNLNEFKNYFKDFIEIYLHENYRSSKEILDNINKITLNMNLKNEVLNYNLQPIENKEQVKLIECISEKAQDTFLIQNISKILDKHKNVKIGVLFRKKSELRKVSNYLNSFGINHIAIGSENFLESEIVKEVLKVIQIINKPKESNAEWFSLFKYFNIRDESIKKIFRVSKLKEKPILVLLKKDLESLISFEDEVDVLNLINNLLNNCIELYNSKISLESLIRTILFKFNFYQTTLLANNLEAVFNLNKLLNFSKNYTSIYHNSNIDNFLRICELSQKFDFNSDLDLSIGDNIELLTIHNSKGKEFDYVFIPYLNERKFPSSFKQSQFDILNIDIKEAFLEEEKRLFFVGISRCKKELFLSYVTKFEGNKLDSKPSSFLEILDLKKETFRQEYDYFDLENKDKIKLELIERVNKYLLSRDYKKAVEEIKLIESLFENSSSSLSSNSSSNLGLNKFLSNPHPDYNTFKKKLVQFDYLDIDINPSSMVYSVSQLKTYESCPKKYLYSYIYKIPTEPKHFFDFGTSVHSVFEEIVNLIDRLPKEAVFANAVSFLRKKWISKGYVSANQEKEYFEKGVEAIKKFIDKELSLRKEIRKLVSQEAKFIIELEGKKIMGFIDRIDLVNGNYEILDYKTSNSMMTKSQLKDDLQLYIYSLACKDLNGKYPESVGLWYVIFDEILSLKFDEIDSKKLKDKALNLISGIEKKEFKPNPSFFACKFCDYSRICKDSLDS